MGTQVQEDQEIMFPSFGLSVEHESMPDSHRCTGCTGFFPETAGLCSRKPQIRTRSSPASASPAAPPVDYPVHDEDGCPVRGAGARLAGKREFPKGDRPAFSAGGTPALPGGLPPMTGSHQRDKSAEAFWRQLSLKEVHQSSCLFVFIGGSSSLTSGCFSSE